jgi:hypothetical protein
MMTTILALVLIHTTLSLFLSHTHKGNAQQSQRTDRSCVVVPPASPLYSLAVKAVAAAVPALSKGSKGGKGGADTAPVPSSPSTAYGSVAAGGGIAGREESSDAKTRCKGEYGDEDDNENEDEDESQGQGHGQGQGEGQTVGGVWMPKIGESLLQSL